MENLLCICGWGGCSGELITIGSDPDNCIYCPDCECSGDLEKEE